MDWKSQKVLDQLFSLLREGKTAQQIADTMGAPSRSAVTGVVDRMRKAGTLPGDVKFLYAQTAAANRGVPRKQRKRKSRQKVDIVATGQIEMVTVYDDIKSSPALEEFNAKRKGVPLTDLKINRCKWPVKDDPYLFCGAPADGSYCEFHKGHGGRAYIGRKRENSPVFKSRFSLTR